jgi:hypothetical protein
MLMGSGETLYVCDITYLYKSLSTKPCDYNCSTKIQVMLQGKFNSLNVSFQVVYKLDKVKDRDNLRSYHEEGFKGTHCFRIEV